ncbi:MAG TPA: hypothetical protein VNZ04_13090 [Trinickia sp.]|nr:hypothetical protein [Trinickia sp.]
MSLITTIYVICVGFNPDHNCLTQSPTNFQPEHIMTQAHQGTALIAGASTGIGAVNAERLNEVVPTR